ncbi:hypothetical protein D1007_51261 [Hordeum vulgare]|nr:hypothetical protein D1007_51261 [Hordeum vulgare]
MRGDGFGAGRHGRGAGRFNRGAGRGFDSNVWKRKSETGASSSTRASGSDASGFDKWDAAAGGEKEDRGHQEPWKEGGEGRSSPHHDGKATTDRQAAPPHQEKWGGGDLMLGEGMPLSVMRWDILLLDVLRPYAIDLRGKVSLTSLILMLRDSLGIEITTSLLLSLKGLHSQKDIEAELSVYVGQGWRCSAKFFAPQRFVMRMPNPREIERALFVEHVKLKKYGVSVKFSPWSDDLESEGLLEVAWVKIGRIPINKRCNKTVAYVGGLVGITLEVDMSTLNRPASVRAKIGCRHVDQIPTSAEGVLGSRFYKFTYEVEEVLVKNTVMEQTAVPVARDDASKQNLTPKRKRGGGKNCRLPSPEKEVSGSEESEEDNELLIESMQLDHEEYLNDSSKWIVPVPLDRGNNTPERCNDLKDVQVTFSCVVRKSLSYADVVTNNWQVSELEGEADPNMKISCDYVVLSPETDHNVDVIPTPPIASEAATRFSKRNTCGMQEKVEDRATRLAIKRDLEGNPQLRNNSFSVLSDAELISRASNMGVIIPDGSFACIDVLRELEQLRMAGPR